MFPTKPQISLVAYYQHAPPKLFHGLIRHQTSHIKKLGSPSDPITTITMCTFSLPPLAPHHHQNPCAPVTDITHASGIVAAQSPNSATATKGAHQHRKLTVVDPPNGIRAAHVPTAFPVAAIVTELPDDVNRPIGQTYCVGPRNRWRQPIRGCGHHPLQPHRCH